MKLLDQPAQQHRFVIQFFGGSNEEETFLKLKGYEYTYLSRNVSNFKFDRVTKDFWISFLLPRDCPDGFYLLLDSVKSFDLHVLDDADNSTGVTKFIVDKYISSYTEFDYSKIEFVTINLQGVYK